MDRQVHHPPALLPRFLFAFLIAAAMSGTAFGASVTLHSPNGLQQWEAGAQRRILFGSTDVVNVRLELSSDDGATWSGIIASAPAAGGAYLWTVPAAPGNAYRIRVSDAADALTSDVSDQAFAVVPEKTGDEFDHVFFSDSPTAVSYDPSYTTATAPSTLERASGTKWPVTTAYSLVGSYSLRMSWTSAVGGDWAAANAGIGWVGRDITVKDSLVFHVLTETPTPAAGLPCIYLEDTSNRKSAKLPLSTLLPDLPAGSWQRIAIPIQAFRDNPGFADLTRIKTIFLGQQTADATPRVWYLDDFRMTGGTTITGDSTRLIVVLGSSTAAGTGASTPDSSWVGRYRAYVRGLDPQAVVVNLAIGGYTTYHVMPTGYVPPGGRPSPSPYNNITYALAYKPWAILVNLPSNDVASGYPVAEQLANYDTLCARADAQGVPIWITTAQPRNFANASQRDQLRIMTDSTLARYAPRAIDVYHDLAAPDGTILPQYGSGDGIHLNNAGHRVVYEKVVGAGVWEEIDPVVEVVHPDGGEVLHIGSPDTLRWSAIHLDHVTGFELGISRDGRDGPWEPIASVAPDRTSYVWDVAGPVASDTCYLRVVAVGLPGELADDDSDAPFSVADVVAAPFARAAGFGLDGPTPNPTRGLLRLSFSLPVAAEVELTVLDVQGREVGRPASGRFAAGQHETRWDAGALPAGLYFARCRALGREVAERFLLVR
jgi:lysophospholipase L1-like esterase